MSEKAEGGGGLSALSAAAMGAKRPVNLFNKERVDELFADLTTGINYDERSQYQFRINRNLDEILIYYKKPGEVKKSLVVRPLESRDKYNNIIVFEFRRTEPGSNIFEQYDPKEGDDDPLLDVVEEINRKQNIIVNIIEEDYTTNGSYFALRKSRRNTTNKRQKSRRKRRSARQN